MLKPLKRTVATGHVREVRLVRVSVCGLLVGRDRADPKAIKASVNAKRKERRLEREAFKADQADLLQFLADAAGMSVPLFRAKLLLENAPRN